MMLIVALLVLDLLIFVSLSSSCHAFIINNNQNIRCEHQTSLYSSPSTIQAIINKSYSRQEAQDMVANTLCPPNEERDRSTAGMEAYSVVGQDRAITNDDPRTYV